jgi:hypothetical protein
VLFYAAVLPWAPGFAAAQTSQPAAEQAQLLRTDSRAPYVHRLTLYDADGKAINPADKDAPPYSPRATCGKCHEYGLIAQGYHFNAARSAVTAGQPVAREFIASAGDPRASDPRFAPLLDDTHHGRRGEPWIWTDPATGTALPLSYRGWPGTFRPEEVGITPRGFLARFGAFLPGGGIGESPRLESRGSEAGKGAAGPSDAKRWEITGPLEIDCMSCHAATAGWDLNEWARQIEAENYRWAPTAALGLGVVRGAAKRLPDDYDPFDPASAGRPDQQPPRVEYRKPLFDADDRVFFDVVRTPPDAACLQCHSTREVGAGARQPWQLTPDVHTAAGIRCADCHRNDIHHHTIRGYPGEPMQPPDAAALTCRGCHLGVSIHADAALALGGHFAAPHPRHAGLPAIHLELMSCTACHSGPWPQERPRAVQTSLAHGLGISTKERTETQPPRIAAPLFVRRPGGGPIEPVRAHRPAYWAREQDGKLAPLALATVQAAARKVLARAKSKQPGDEPLASEDIAVMLKQLAAGAAEREKIVYVRGAERFELGAGGELTSRVEPDALLHWPLAHEVRPASQSLGARGCTDCHADDAPIYAGQVEPAGGPDRPVETRMYDLTRSDPALAGAWSALFGWRGPFRWFAVACLVVTSVGLLALLVSGLIPRPSEGVAAPGAPSAWLADGLGAAFGACVVALTASGVAIWLWGAPFPGWKLWVHVVIAAPFLVGLAGFALVWARRHGGGAGGTGGMWWLRTLFLLLGWVTVASVLVLMIPVFGYSEQPALVAAHRVAGLALVFVGLAVLVYPRLRKRPAGKH